MYAKATEFEKSEMKMRKRWNFRYFYAL